MKSLLSGSVIFAAFLFAFSAVAQTDASSTESVISEKSLSSAVSALESTPSSTSPFWTYSIFGSNIGAAGMLPITNEHGTEVIVSGTRPRNSGRNNFWYVLNHDPATGTYQQIHVHPPYTGGLASMSLGNVTDDATAELVVGLTDGSFFFYSTSTFEERGAVQPVTSLTDFATVDLDGDGTAELIVLTGSDLKVFNPAGKLLWSIIGVGGSGLVVAQMDQDPALEIATASGHVVDAGTRSVQWTRSGGFASTLRAADIDGDGRAELIGSTFRDLIAYDVDLKLTKWTYHSTQYIEAIEVANVDSDPEMELLYGDGPSGKLHVMTLNNAAPVEEWNVLNDDLAILRITVADTDSDGVAEILWTSGAGENWRESLKVLDTVTRKPKWRSPDISGRFLSPAVGDVTGDGVPELVTVSCESGGYYYYPSQRILVFDSETLKLLGIFYPGGNDPRANLKLRDVNGDGRLEIVVTATSGLNDGFVGIYSFTDSRTFELKWDKEIPGAAPLSQVDVLDVDGDGNLEVVLVDDYSVRVIDYATKTEESCSSHGGSWTSENSAAIGDINGDGHAEAVVSTPNVGVTVVDLALRSKEFTQYGDFRTVAVSPGRAGFLVGTGDGKVNYFTPNGAGSYEVTDSWTASTTAVTGLTPCDDDSLWVNTDQRVSYWPDSTGSVWTSDKLGSEVIGPISLLDTAHGVEMYAGVTDAIYGFQVSTSDISKVRMSLTGSLAEGCSSTASLVFVRDEVALDTPVEVLFELYGNALVGVDFTFEGATHLEGSKWKLLIPAGSQAASATFRSIQDRIAEGPEIVGVRLLSTNENPISGFFTATAITLEDDEPIVSVAVTDTNAREPLGKEIADPGEFVFHRTGDLSRPLEVRFSLDGSATVGVDYGAIATRVIFPIGRDTVNVTIMPRADHEAEWDERVDVQLLPSRNYLVDRNSTTGSITLTDSGGEPVVSVVGAQTFTGGVAVTLRRTGEDTKPFIVTLAVTSYDSNGQAPFEFRRAFFRKGAESAQCLFRPKKKAKETVLVRVELLKDENFHVGYDDYIDFYLPPALPQ